MFPEGTKIEDLQRFCKVEAPKPTDEWLRGRRIAFREGYIRASLGNHSTSALEGIVSPYELTDKEFDTCWIEGYQQGLDDLANGRYRT